LLLEELEASPQIHYLIAEGQVIGRHAASYGESILITVGRYACPRLLYQCLHIPSLVDKLDNPVELFRICNEAESASHIMRKVQGNLVLCLLFFEDLFALGECGEVISQG
jgi:hypothetical protein